MKDTPENEYQSDDEPAPEPILRRLSDVESKPVSWLWEGRIALGKLTLLAGDPGLGKSFLSLDVAARVSRGAEWPDGRGVAPEGEVLLLNAEDDAADTIKPRLVAAVADCRNIQILDGLLIGDKQRQITLAHLSVIEAALDGLPDCRLLIVDPISAFCGYTESHKDAEVRAMLKPLAELAARRGLAVLAVTHLRKGEGAAIYRAMGSLAFSAAARAVWAVAKHPADESRRVLACVKNNLAEDRGGLEYHLSGDPACVVWLGESNATADELLGTTGKPGRPAKALESGKRFLQQVLGEGQRVAVKELESMAQGAGVSRRTLERAREELGVESEPSGFGAQWVCFLPVSPSTGILADTSKTDDFRAETPQENQVSPVSANTTGMGNTGDTLEW